MFGHVSGEQLHPWNIYSVAFEAWCMSNHCVVCVHSLWFNCWHKIHFSDVGQGISAIRRGQVWTSLQHEWNYSVWHAMYRVWGCMGCFPLKLEREYVELKKLVTLLLIFHQLEDAEICVSMNTNCISTGYSEIYFVLLQVWNEPTSASIPIK